ncbi:MAG: hypothetical protein M3083_15530 [Actinomycetota bacterium]|nr:hypothetical protein [Actinomycetota bacterium]MDQ6945300.1 hypothetical protein [Actinomycetota bacterium]
MTTITAAPLDLSASQLEEMFAASPAGDIPTGRGTGTAIFFAGRRAAKPFAAFAHAVLWQGKIFRPESHDLKNLMGPFSFQAVRAAVYSGESWYDGRPCVVLDYSKTSKVAGRIRDEIRQIGPHEYLGMVFKGARRLGVYFLLRFE